MNFFFSYQISLHNQCEKTDLHSFHVYSLQELLPCRKIYPFHLNVQMNIINANVVAEYGNSIMRELQVDITCLVYSSVFSSEGSLFSLHFISKLLLKNNNRF